MFSNVAYELILTYRHKITMLFVGLESRDQISTLNHRQEACECAKPRKLFPMRFLINAFERISKVDVFGIFCICCCKKIKYVY